MNCPRHVDAELVSRLKHDLLGQTINSLEVMGGDCLLSSEDSGLKSVWEEVCVQVQDEKSFHWDTYIEVIEDFLIALVGGLPQEERLALWLSTDEGYEWIVDNEGCDTDGTATGVFVGDIVEELKSDLLSKAADFENSRIERYLRRQNRDDEWDEEEDEEEIEFYGEDELADGELSSPLVQLTDQEIEPIFDSAVAEVEAERTATVGSQCSFDNHGFRNALDEQGKAALDHSMQELSKIFGSRAEKSNLPLPTAGSKTSDERLSQKIDSLLVGSGIDRPVAVAAIMVFLRSLHEVLVKADCDQVDLLSQVQTALGSTPAYHLARIICEDRHGFKSYPPNQICQLQKNIEKLCRERGMTSNSGMSLFSLFLKALDEERFDNEGNCHSAVVTTYFAIGDEAAFHLGGLFVGDDSLEISTELQYLDHRLKRFRKTIELWQMEMAWDKKDRG